MTGERGSSGPPAGGPADWLPAWAEDLVGLEAGVAAAAAGDRGYAVRFVATAPPWKGVGQGAERVVRVRPAGDDVLELTVAREGWTRVGRENP